MTLAELKEIINNIDNKYDNYVLYNDFFSNKEIDIDIKILDYIGHKYLDVDLTF